MSRTRDRKARRHRIRFRYRQAVRGTAERPRLAVYRSLRHTYAQIIDDERGVTVASASTLESDLAGDLTHGGNRQAGALIGRTVAERAKEAGVATVVFDRGGFPYHGVIRSLAEAAREAGLEF